MKHPTGKTLFEDSRGRLWITSREVARDGVTGYALLRVTTQIENGFQHKYEAVQAAELVPLDPGPDPSAPVAASPTSVGLAAHLPAQAESEER